MTEKPWRIPPFSLPPQGRSPEPEAARDTPAHPPPPEAAVAPASLEVSLARLMAQQSEDQVRWAEIQKSLAGVEAQFARAGKEQFKANATAEARQKSLEQLLERQREADAARDRELGQLRERLATARDAARLEVVRDLLPVLDGLEEALASGARLTGQRQARAAGGFGARLQHALLVLRGTPPDFAAVSDPLEGWLAGVSLLRERLLEVLRAAGVQPIPTAREPFDPHRHVAVETVAPTPAAPAGTIVREVRRGYTQGETVIRYAEVVVARAPLPADLER